MSKVDNVTSHRCMQFQGKHMIQTQENGEKPHFGPNLGQLGPIGRAISFSFKNLAIIMYNIRKD